MSKSPKIIHSSDFRKQPFFLKTINQLWQLSYPLNTKIKLDKESCIKMARRKTGLQDLGKDFWEEPLERLLRSADEEAKLSPFGRFITRERIVSLLATRLRAEYWFKKHPEILEQALYPTLVIAGLQRTGTTKLQRLLAADPGNRVLYSWEALNPAPWLTTKEKEKRISEARRNEKAVKLLSPGFFAIHPIQHLSAEEDILLLDVSFMSTTTEATMYVPTYSKWLEQIDQSLAYAYLVKLLKLLQWQQPARQWVLKTPHHLEFLPLIQKHFEEVKFIWTHRNVEECIPSFLSMLAHSRTLFSNQVNLEDLTSSWLPKLGYMLGQALTFREQNKAAQFIDISYPDFIQNPIDRIEDIYKDRTPMSNSLRQQFILANLQNKAHQYGRHQYQLSDFNLAKQDLLLHVGHYVDWLNNQATIKY